MVRSWTRELYQHIFRGEAMHFLVVIGLLLAVNMGCRERDQRAPVPARYGNQTGGEPTVDEASVKRAPSAVTPAPDAPEAAMPTPAPAPAATTGMKKTIAADIAGNFDGYYGPDTFCKDRERDMLEVFEDKVVLSTILYVDAACVTEGLVYRFTFAVDGFEEPKLNVHMTGAELTLLYQPYVSDANDDAVYEYTDWRTGVKKDILNKRPTASDYISYTANVKYYGLISFSREILSFAVGTLKEADRPKAVMDANVAKFTRI